MQTTKLLEGRKTAINSTFAAQSADSKAASLPVWGLLPNNWTLQYELLGISNGALS